MKIKNVPLIIMIAIGFFLVLSGLYFTNLNDNNNKDSIDNNNSNLTDDPNIDNIVENDNSYSGYDDVYQMAITLYGGKDKIIELKEEEKQYVIIIKDFSGNLLDTLNYDKETGVITGEPQIFEETVYR